MPLNESVFIDYDGTHERTDRLILMIIIRPKHE